MSQEEHFERLDYTDTLPTLEKSVIILRELLVEYDHFDEEDAKDLERIIRKLRTAIEQQVTQEQLKPQNQSATEWHDYFQIRSCIFLLIAEAALETNDLDDAYTLYSTAVSESVTLEHKLDARLGAMFCRSIIQEPLSDADMSKCLEDLEEAIQITDGNDKLTNILIRSLCKSSFREFQTKIMYAEQDFDDVDEFEEPEECPPLISGIIREAIIKTEMPEWTSFFFEGLLSYIENNEPEKTLYFKKALKYLPKETFSESRKALRSFMKVHG